MSTQLIARKFVGIQMLRFLAAFLVVVCHCSFVVSEQMPYLSSKTWEKGGIGVSIFFVISGFVITASGDSFAGRRGGWKIFAYRRLLRIVPMYWIATTFKLIVVLVQPGVTLHSEFNWWHVLCSYLFLPSRNPLGVITPLHAVGWTLTYEMFFYALFCASIYLSLPPIRWVAAVFALLLTWGLVNPSFTQDWAVLSYTSPLLLEFFLGMLIAKMVPRLVRLPPYVGLIPILAGIALICRFDVLSGWPSFFCHGIPSAMVVAGVVLLEPWFANRRLAVPQLLGDASYSLYLFHPFVIGLCIIMFSKVPWTGVLLLIGMMATVCVVASVVIYQWVERPVTIGIKRAVDSRELSFSPQPSFRP